MKLYWTSVLTINTGATTKNEIIGEVMIAVFIICLFIIIKTKDLSTFNIWSIWVKI